MRRKMRKQPLGRKSCWDFSLEAGDRILLGDDVVDLVESGGWGKRNLGELSYRITKKPHPKAKPVEDTGVWYWEW